MVIIAEKGAGEAGYVAIDSLIFKDNGNCETIPVEATVTTPTPAITTTAYTPSLANCDFEQGLCGWSKDSELNRQE